MEHKIGITCIVDDDNLYVFGLRKLISIKKLCQHVEIYTNGQEALQSLTSRISDPDALPDLLLLDINMPVMDGWEFIEEFVKIKPCLSKPIIIYMVSSSINVLDIQRAKSLSSVSDYIIKPVTEEQLEQIFGKVAA